MGNVRTCQLEGGGSPVAQRAEDGDSDRYRIGRAVGKKIKSLRLARGWSQEALARKLEMARETVRHTENGRLPEWKTLEKFADALGVTLFELLGSEDPGAKRSILMAA